MVLEKLASPGMNLPQLSSYRAAWSAVPRRRSLVTGQTTGMINTSIQGLVQR